MTDYRVNIIKKITKKVLGLVDELELLTDAELRHLNEYDACEDVCLAMSDANVFLRKAAFKLQEAEAAAGLEDIQDKMQQDFDSMTVTEEDQSETLALAPYEGEAS